jgi:cob(I)alamin adenosyltransferase
MSLDNKIELGPRIDAIHNLTKELDVGCEKVATVLDMIHNDLTDFSVFFMSESKKTRRVMKNMVKRLDSIDDSIVGGFVDTSKYIGGNLHIRDLFESLDVGLSKIAEK